MKKYFLFLQLLCLTSFIHSKINLVWQVDKNGIYETDWLMELLADVDLHVVDDFKYEKYLNNSIVIFTTSHQNKQYERYCKKLHELGYTFGVIHLSDECYEHSAEFYQYAQFIIRNYWHKKFTLNPKVLAIPLGYKREFWKNCSQENPLLNLRKFIWSFAGQIQWQPKRYAMLEALKNIPHHFVYQITCMNDPASLTTADYRTLLLNTIFVPCPRGYWNLDSFRLTEALECGCIPIIEKSPFNYFEKFYGENPFIAISNWSEAPNIITELLSRPDKLEKKRTDCFTWWRNYKTSLKKRVKEFIEAHLP